MDAPYNDIQQWKYIDLLNVFGADPKKSKSYQVKTKQEAEDLFNDKDFSSAPYLQVRIEIVNVVRSCTYQLVAGGVVYAQGRCAESAEADGEGECGDECEAMKWPVSVRGRRTEWFMNE